MNSKRYSTDPGQTALLHGYIAQREALLAEAVARGDESHAATLRAGIANAKAALAVQPAA